MVKLECIVRPEKFEPVREALSEFGIKGMTVSQVMGCGMQKGHTQFYRGTELSVTLLPKIKLEIVTTDDRVQDIVKLIRSVAVTGNIGDGKIFISPINDSIRMRTGETGNDSLI
jgi:nitrogen regulatory protein P-II 1